MDELATEVLEFLETLKTSDEKEDDIGEELTLETLDFNWHGRCFMLAFAAVVLILCSLQRN